MSDKPEASEVRGCMFIIGIVITGIALGSIFDTAIGWLAVGVIALWVGIFAR